MTPTPGAFFMPQDYEHTIGKRLMEQAAPDMLKALELVVKTFNEAMDHNGEPCISSALLSAICETSVKAINKAKGQ